MSFDVFTVFLLLLLLLLIKSTNLIKRKTSFFKITFHDDAFKGL